MVEQSRLRDSDEFAPTIDAAAERLAISATAIEKDYWVSEVLRVLAAQFADDFVLKGGTSLSKGYHLIQRFSEDIDLLVLSGSRGRGAIDRLMKQMAESAAAGIGGDASAFGGAETGRHRSFDIGYPAVRPATDLIRTSVLLEIGVRGGDHPQETAYIGCLLGDLLADAGTDLNEFSDLMPFPLVVLHPGRTLLEKLVGVHAEARRLAADPELAADRRIGRHFYDVHELLADEPVRHLLADRAQVERILEEVEEITRAHFIKPGETVEVRPPGGFAESPAFEVGSDVSERLRAAYEATMPHLHFGSDPLPTWPAICDRLREHRPLL